MTKEYSAASVSFLDRDTNTEKTAYLYPITTLELRTSEGKIQTIFIVKDGKWVKNGKTKRPRQV